MANSTQDEAKYEVCFVQTGDSPEKAPDVLKHAFEAMDSNQLDPIWKTVEDCLNISKKEPKLFVLEPFEGVVFEHLKTLQCRILGPLCILYCLQYSDVLPKRSYPVYSVSMRKITVSCSNIPVKLRDEISTKVQLMGGFFSKDLTKSVTHLVVGEVGSQKYKVAANFGIPIMVPEWIADVWEKGQYEQLHASDSCYDKYKCPIFKGLVITVSQLSAEERLTIKKVIEDNGGSYSGSLKSSETTHLILNEPTGDKYRFAKSWKVICVNAKWVLDSVEAGYCRDEALYSIDEAAQTQPKRSTPKKDLTSCELPLVDCSVIVGQPGVSHLDETMRSEFSLSLMNKRNSYVPLDQFNLSTLPKSGQFLDGCKIFLTGFNPSQMDKLRKIVNSGSGMRFSKYSDSISHVVCGELSEDLLKNIKSSSTKPFVVNYKWLLECCKMEKLIDEKTYLCVDMNTLSPEKKQEDMPKIDISIHMSQNSSQVKKDDFPDENMADIFKQYISGPQLEDDKENKGCKLENQKNSFKSKSLSLNGSKKSLSLRGVKHNDFPQTDIPVDLEAETGQAPPNVNTDVENGFEANGDEAISSSENLFSGIKFIVVGFGEKDCEILSRMVETHSGTVSNITDALSDIAIVPLIWHDLSVSASNIVTNCWLQKCIEESRIFDMDENELFRPFALDLEKKPFESFVISFSQYAGTERDCLIHLAESLGAICQDYFVRKANAAKGVLSNTHLVVSIPDGSKYEASKKWKIPAVTKQWVIDAAKSGTVPPVDKYLVDKFPEFNPCEEEPKCVQNISIHTQIEKKNSFSESKTEKIELRSDRLSESCNRKTPKVSMTEPCNKSVSVTETVENKVPTETKKSDDSVSCVPLQHSRITELCNESRRESINRSSNNRPSAENSPNVSVSLDGNFQFHVSGILNDLDNSRESFGNSKKHSLSLGEMFSRNLAVALNRMDAKLNFEKDDSKVFEENDNKSDKPDVLSGVVLYVSRKLSNMQIELNEIVVQLGGSYIWSYDDSCTHFVFVGKVNDITKEFREARNKGKKIVSPEWVHACKEKKCHVEEELYPHTYKANMTLSQQISILKAPPSTVDASKESIPETKPAEDELQKGKDDKQLQSPDVVPVKNEEVDFNKQLTELLNLAKCAKKRQSKRMTNSSSSSPVAEKSPIPTYQRQLSDSVGKTGLKANAAEEPDTGSQSQSYPITWDDPTGRLEREKIAALVAKNAEDSRIEDEIVEVVDVPEKVPAKKKSFMFTNIPDSLKAEYIEVVKKLGGETVDEKAFDIHATHLILSNPIKNEKFLSSVASGKWVLHPLYLSESLELEKFANEEEYEWGGTSTEKFLKNLPGSSSKIAECPHRWRCKIQQGLVSGAFHSWQVVIHADDQVKLSTYMKILKAGGADIIPPELAHSSLDKITHVFVEIKKKSVTKIDLSLYVSNNIKCVKPEYLAFYLIEDPPPDIESFLVSERHLSGSMSLSKRRNLSTASRQSKSKKTRLK